MGEGETSAERTIEPGDTSRPHPPLGKHPLGMLLFRISRAMIFENKPVLEMQALPLGQLRLLMTVRLFPEETMSDYSERLNVSQSTTTQFTDQLVRRGFLTRLADPNDRRIIRLALTPHALELIQLGDEQRDKFTETTWDEIEEAERANVLNFLEILAQAAERARVKIRQKTSEHDSMIEETTELSDTASAQPVVDIISRRVRGN